MAEITETKEDKIKKSIAGISFSSSFILMGIFFYFLPGFFYNETFTTIIGLISITIGIIALSFELSNINHHTVGYSDLGLGFGFIIIWMIQYYYLPYLWSNILGLFFLYFGLYGSVSGVATLLYGFITDKESRNKIFVKSVVVLLQLVGFISAILTILSAFKNTL